MGWGSGRSIEANAEYRRIQSLPRRKPQLSEELRQELTRLLKTPEGTMVLKPAQALALHDIGTKGGLGGPIRVGGGKTLISLLAPYVLEARRPLLLVPAGLVSKTEDDRRQLMRHWRIPRNMRVQSYEGLGRVSFAKYLDLYRPDLIVCDEAHRLKNKRAACTRRVVRYMQEHPDTKVIVLSGTLIKHSIRDFAHLMAWALKDGSPVPTEEGDIDEWADALDEKVNPLTRVRTGVLGADLHGARIWLRDRILETEGIVSAGGDSVACSLYVRGVEYEVNEATENNFKVLRDTWCQPCGWPMSMAAEVWRCARELALGFHYVWWNEKGFRECLGKTLQCERSSIGSIAFARATELLSMNMSASPLYMVGSATSAGCEAGARSDVSRSITTTAQDVFEACSASTAIEQSRNWETLLKAFPALLPIFRRAVEAARPPRDWLDARKAWAKYVREMISAHSRGETALDSELMVVNAVDRVAALADAHPKGRVSEDLLEGHAILAEWRRIRPTFEINSKPVWHDDSALEFCLDWMRKHQAGIVWCEHIFFAQELERRWLKPGDRSCYYGAGGLNRTDHPISEELGDRPIIASIAANGTGRNLQMFSQNLITSCLTGADQIEQLLGRTHREGQEADQVEVDIMVGCAEHHDAFAKACSDARMHQEMMGQDQKLLYADVDWPALRRGAARWIRSTGEKE